THQRHGGREPGPHTGTVRPGRNAPARSGSPPLGAAAGGHRAGAPDGTGAYPWCLRRESSACRAGGTGVPVAGDGVRTMAKDPELLAHQQWLGYLQPVGLVVSPPALLQAQAHINANVAAEHQRFLEHVGEVLVVGRPEPLPAIQDLRALLLDVFGW